MNEFTGPNFTVNGYANARYRSEQNTKTIRTEHETYNILTSLEAMNTEGTWQPHPTVFRITTNSSRFFQTEATPQEHSVNKKHKRLKAQRKNKGSPKEELVTCKSS